MVYLVAAVVLVGALGLTNLVLTLGVIRRLREHTELLSNRIPPGPSIRAAGETVDDFATTTVDGRSFRRGDLADGTLVGFFAPGCTACAKQLSQFLELAEAWPGGRAGTVAIVVGAAESSRTLCDELGRVAGTVLREGEDPVVSMAFAVTAFPAYAVVDAGGLVAAGALNLESLPIRVTV